MKDSLVNLLVFGLLFAVVAAFVVGGYALYNGLVPGGRGLIFGTPYSAALLGSLVLALVVAQYRAIHHPGRFTLTWLALGLGFFFLLTAAVPLIQNAPPFRSPDASPLVPGRFVTLEDGGTLLAPPGTPLKGQFANLVVNIPGDGTPMSLVDTVTFDPLNRRFLLGGADGGTHNLVETGPERAYFEYPDFYRSLQLDLFAITKTLRDTSEAQPTLFVFETAAITLLFLGLFFFLSFRTWPLVQMIVVVFMARVEVSFLAWVFHGLPLVVANWVQDASLAFWQAVLPVALIVLAGLALLFMTMLTKPHRVEARE